MLQQALAERLLPPLLIMNDRQPCTRDSWPKRRQELLRRLETHIYGVTPPSPDDVESQLLRQDDHDLADKAITRQILLRFATQDEPRRRAADRANALSQIVAELKADDDIVLGDALNGDRAVPSHR